MASEIAASEDLPEYFFSKEFEKLAKSGLINSFRGRNGGFGGLGLPVRKRLKWRESTSQGSRRLKKDRAE